MSCPFNLEQAAEIYNFRRQNPDESAQDYREAMANHIAPLDATSALEILLNKRHEDFDKDEQLALIALQMGRSLIS